MAAISALTGILGGSVSEQSKSRKEARRAQQIQERSARLQSGRQAIDQIRQAQIARAGIIAAGAEAGALSSSAVIGGAGSIQSQAGANVGFIQQLATLQAQANERMNRAQRHAGNASALTEIASINWGL